MQSWNITQYITNTHQNSGTLTVNQEGLVQFRSTKSKLGILAINQGYQHANCKPTNMNQELRATVLNQEYEVQFRNTKG